MLGFPDVAKNCMLQSFHQSGEQFEILFNKTKYTALSQELKSIIDYAVQAASADMSWKAIDRNTKDYEELKKAGVKFYKTPDAILRAQLAAWDKIIAKKASGERIFKKVLDSQRAFAERAGAMAERLHGGLQDGVQPLLRPPGGAGQEGLSAKQPRGAPGEAPLFVACRKEHDAEVAAGGGPVLHLVRQDLRVDRLAADDTDQPRGVLALRAQPPAWLGARRADHAVRHAVHDRRAPTRSRRTATCAATCCTASSCLARRRRST